MGKRRIWVRTSRKGSSHGRYSGSGRPRDQSMRMREVRRCEGTLLCRLRRTKYFVTCNTFLATCSCFLNSHTRKGESVVISEAGAPARCLTWTSDHDACARALALQPATWTDQTSTRHCEPQSSSLTHRLILLRPIYTLRLYPRAPLVSRLWCW